MSITLKKISDEQNDLGFHEIILLGCRVSGCIHSPNTPIIDNGRLIMDDVEIYKFSYEWLALLDGQLLKVDEEELFASIHCYEIDESDKVKAKQLVYKK